MRDVYDVVDEIEVERWRQIEAEGWDMTFDDKHTHGEMAQAAACYAYFAGCTNGLRRNGARDMINRLWPLSWPEARWKPKNRRRDLIRAGALIVAEIERLDRIEEKTNGIS
jgi:hypothetical protein